MLTMFYFMTKISLNITLILYLENRSYNKL